jgi:FkbM family methyltransferase
MKSSFIQRYVWPKIKKIPGLRLLALRANSAVNMIQGRKIIEYEGFLIQVPSRHPILGLQKEGPRESLLRAVSRHCFSASRDHYVDVGAHIGDTALVIEKSSEQKNLKSDLIDPSLFFTEFLIKNSKFLHAPTIHSKFAATDFPSKNIFGVLHHWSGNAELVDEGSKLLALASQQLQVGSVITSKTALVKIDCEGLDLRILHSIIMYGSLDSCKPSFVFECTLRSLSSS